MLLGSRWKLVQADEIQQLVYLMMNHDVLDFVRCQKGKVLKISSNIRICSLDKELFQGREKI